MLDLIKMLGAWGRVWSVGGCIELKCLELKGEYGELGACALEEI